MDDWTEVTGFVSKSYADYRPRHAEAIEEIVSRAAPAVQEWAARELAKHRVPSEDFPTLLPTLQRIAQTGGFWEKTWDEAKRSATPNKWVYLNGQVEFHEQPFKALRGLAEREGNQEAGALANHWLAGNMLIPHGHKDAIAHGEITPDGHVLFLNTNADRNEVRDSVLKRTAGFGPWTAWNMDSTLHTMPNVANEYESLKHRQPTPEEVAAWHQLAAENTAHANYIRQHLNVNVTDNPEPYATPDDMINDIKNNRNFVVSQAFSDHPVWTPKQNVDFRTVHDVFGHAATGGDFGWEGENHACSTHHALLSPAAAKALTTECLGQTGWAMHNGGFGDQHIGFMNQTHNGLMAANANARPTTREELMQRALAPAGRSAASIGPINKSPHGPSPWSPEGRQKLFTIGIGNTDVPSFTSWVQEYAPSMIPFMRVQDGTGIFEGSPETSVSARFFDTDLKTVKHFLDFYGQQHPQEWGFGLEWGTGSTVYQNKANANGAAQGNLDTDDWTVHEAKADLNGSMVSLDVPEQYHSTLAVKGGEKPKDLHMTLAYLPEGIKDPSGVANLLNDVAGKMKPPMATIKKLDQFPETADKDIPHIATLEGDQLHDLHQAVAAGLKALGENVSEKHDFTPHITLKYTRPDEEFEHHTDLKGMQLHFPALHLHEGGDVQEFQLGKSPMAMSAHGPMGITQDDDWMIWG